MGCVYIAYTEGRSRTRRRAQYLLDSLINRNLSHRRLILVPLTAINRFCPQTLGNGGIELLERVIQLTLEGCKHMLGNFPTRVFRMHCA
jgi:hypothetical protein